MQVHQRPFQCPSFRAPAAVGTCCWVCEPRLCASSHPHLHRCGSIVTCCCVCVPLAVCTISHLLCAHPHPLTCSAVASADSSGESLRAVALSPGASSGNTCCLTPQAARGRGRAGWLGETGSSPQEVQPGTAG